MATKRKLSEATNNLDMLFSNAETGQSQPEETKVKKTKGNTKTAKTEDSVKPKKVFSFRADGDKVDHWRLQAKARGMKVDQLGEKALEEYIRRHKLTENQQKIYDLMKS